MSVSPPIGFGRVRLVRIARGRPAALRRHARAQHRRDRRVRVAKIEKKSARTRRVVLEFG
jgi:misacylated tRNA(Ala) deacylase